MRVNGKTLELFIGVIKKGAVNMRDLQSIYWNCIGLMDEIGMDYGNITDVVINTRAKRRWGQCKARFAGRNAFGDPVYTYEISVSLVLLDEKVPVEGLQNTLIHEIIHTCPGCLNHGSEWKRRADKVRRELGYDIKRTNTLEEKGVSNSIYATYDIKPKYIVRCNKCGKEIGRYKMSNLIKYPRIYSCTCGGDFTRVL